MQNSVTKQQQPVQEKHKVSANVKEKYKVSVDTKMIELYTYNSQTESISNIFPISNAKGETELFGIGVNSNAVYNLVQNSELETGWEFNKLNFTANLLTSFSVDGEADRIFITQFSGKDNTVNFLEIVHLTSGYQAISKFTLEGVRNVIFDNTFYAGLAEEEIILTYVSQSNLGGGSIPIVINIETGRFFSIATNKKSHFVDKSIGSLRPLSLEKSNGKWPHIGLMYMKEGNELNVVFSDTPTLNERLPHCQQKIDICVPKIISQHQLPTETDVTCNGIDVSTDANENLQIYIVRGNSVTNRLYDLLILSQTGGSLEIDNPPEWSNWEEILFGNKENIGMPSSLISSKRKDGTIELFITAKGVKEQDKQISDAGIYHCIQEKPGVNKFSCLFPIFTNNSQYFFGVNKNTNDLVETFISLSKNAGIYRMNQDDSGNADKSGINDWNIQKIESTSPGKDKVVPQKAYRTCVTVFDSMHATAANIECEISASNFMSANIKGSWVTLQPGKTITKKTNALGQICIEYYLYDELYAPKIKVHPAVLKDPVHVRSDRDTVHFLAKKVTIDDLKWNENGKYIVPKKHHNNLQPILKAIKSATKSLDSLYSPTSNMSNYFVEDMDFNGVYLGNNKHAMSDRLDESTLSQQAWQFGVIDGKPTYDEISDQDFKLLCERADNDRQKAAELLGWGFFDDIADAFESVVNAVVDTVADVISIVVKASKALVTLVIDGVKLVISTVLKVAQDVFQVVNMIFDQLAVAFGTVLLWVLKMVGFIFDWDKIKGLKKEIRNMLVDDQGESGIEKAINGFQGIIKNSQKEVVNFLNNFQPDNYQKEIKKFQEVPSANKKTGDIASFNMRTSVFTSNNTNFWNSGTWLLDKAIDEVCSITLGNLDLPNANGIKNAFDGIINTLKGKAAQDLEILKTNILKTLEGIIENPKKLLQQSLSGMAQLFQDLMADFVELARLTIDGFYLVLDEVSQAVSSVMKWLDQEIKLPFITAFYETVMGGKLSILDLICLIIAVPSYAVLEATGQGDTSIYSKEGGVTKQVKGNIAGIALAIVSVATLLKSHEENMLIDCLCAIPPLIALAAAYPDNFNEPELIFWIVLCIGSICSIGFFAALKKGWIDRSSENILELCVEFVLVFLRPIIVIEGIISRKIGKSDAAKIAYGMTTLAEAATVANIINIIESNPYCKLINCGAKVAIADLQLVNANKV